jgi:hypothetical protein
MATVSRYATTVGNRAARVESRIKEAFSRARHERQHADTLNLAIDDIRTSRDWQRLPRIDRARMSGLISGLREWLWSLMTFGYVTPRGFIVARGGCSSSGRYSMVQRERLTSEELRACDTYLRGFAWEGSEPLAWFTGPNLADGVSKVQP